MTRAPLRPAELAFDADGTPRSPDYGDIYHPRAGAFAQARHVFLDGNGLPARWQGRERFVVLETGFGLGNNFLATWQAWRNDAQRCAQLIFVSIERHPLTREDLALAHRDSPAPDLADALLRHWPPLTPDLHRLTFDDGRVQLWLALGDVQDWLPELVVSADAFFLDGFAPAANPRMWDARVAKALGRLAAPDATLATWSAARALREHLTSAGFETRLGAGTGGKRDITLARYAPRFSSRRAAARPVAASERHALIVGGGLAGCATACALAALGWRSTVVERRARIAGEASGNPAGLFHGIVAMPDNAHARLHRRAALDAQAAVRIAIEQHGVDGATHGLLRLETSLAIVAMRARLAALGLPPQYVQALDAHEAGLRAGIALRHPAWFYPAGGWVDPAGLARSYLERAGPSLALRTQAAVRTLQRTTAGWCLRDAHGAAIAEAPTVVLANAGDALRLLGHPAWPVEPVRGQISMADAARLAPLPSVPVAGAGYLLPALGDRAIFGATAQRGDDDASVRDADHRHNLAQLQRLTGRASPLEPADLDGRTAWRWSSRDRLPLIGAVPDPVLPAGVRVDQPRHVPRLPGLFVIGTLGSRGIGWSALGGQVLAALVAGAPVPLEASLLDAIDPARFASRRARQARAGTSSQRRSSA